MMRIISALLLAFSSLAVAAPSTSDSAAGAPELAADAPDRHVVVQGDTLWGISAKFLKDPYRWPDLWQLNKEDVKNPHRIYPGQVLVLDRSGGQPRLRIGEAGDGVQTMKVEPKVRVQDLKQEIAAIPQQVIEPFLSQPLVADEEALEESPRIVAIKEERVIAGTGDTVYAIGLKSDTRQWQVFRPGKRLIDPDSNETLGYEAVLLGTAQLVAKGSPATYQISNARQEIGRDDRLLPAPQPDIINYPQRAPEAPIAGRVISVYGSGLAGANYSVVALSKGKRDGVAVGHVLALFRPGGHVQDRYRDRKTDIALPDERTGLLYVFRTFDRVAYALVMQTDRPVEVGDNVRNP